jgi:lysophospholipase L1-like esterase
MSEYVGYNADGTPNTKYGNSIADVIGNNLGINVTNLATGGETSNEALAGGSKFGAFAEYIAQNKPEYAIIRYGAADAIKNKDPNVTLQSIQQMVDIARANGVTPIIVGVSELYGAQNSKTGNIAGYIDPAAEQPLRMFDLLYQQDKAIC